MYVCVYISVYVCVCLEVRRASRYSFGSSIPRHFCSEIFQCTAMCTFSICVSDYFVRVAEFANHCNENGCALLGMQAKSVEIH